MDTLFVNGSEYVDKATYIRIRDSHDILRETKVSLEAEIERLRYCRPEHFADFL